MEKKTVNISESELKELYLNEKLSTREVAKKLGVGQTTVRRKMKEYNIPARTEKESRQTESFRKRREELAERYKKEYTKVYEKKCECCGKTFIVSGADQKNKKFCSKECETQSRRKLERTKDGLLRNTFVCKGCGKTFDNPSLYIINRTYCDNCLSIHRSESQYNRIKVKCGWCGKPIYVTPSRYRSNKINYCSISCMSKDYRKRFSGENSPTWTGGKKHYIGSWQLQRNKARKRDLFRCRICGTTEIELGKELSVHHIRKYKLFTDKKKANSIHNLVCLCPDCHTFIHSNKNKTKLYINNSTNSFVVILKYSLFAIENIATFIKLRLELCWEYLAESSRSLLSHLKDALFH